jgi:gluconolactonase
MLTPRMSIFMRAIVYSAMLLALPVHAQTSASAPEVVATGLHFPEGTIFVGDTLYFVDYSTSDVLRLVQGNVEKVWHQDGCGANGLIENRGELFVACYDSGTVMRISTDGKVRETIRQDQLGGLFVSPNDLAVDAAGGVYFSASGNETVAGRIYYRNAAGRVQLVADGINYSNGLVVSNDKKLLYVAESRSHRVLTFDIDSDGTLSHEAEFANLSAVLADAQHQVFTPDALRIDKSGRLFVGLYDGGGFAVLSPDGKLLKKVELGAGHHASLAISPDGQFVVATTTDDAANGTGAGQLLKVANPMAQK